MGDALLQNGHRYTIPEYEAIAQHARPGERYEYVRGELIPFTDEYTTDAHNQVVINACRLLGDHFYPKGCRVYTENVRLLINEGEEYRLPDVLVTCSERDRASRDAKRDPVVLVEVLSPATALQDLAVKADSYRKIASLQAYLIINPAQVWARLYQRRPTTGEWLPDQALTDLQAEFLVETLALSLPLADLYRFVF
ncbi:MAG: Uma2 family endonuclease [Cytophagales bacterium]|nr:Uma2 family endonuclease [Cytophagales bacterium]